MTSNQQPKQAGHTAPEAEAELIRLGYSAGSAKQYLGDALLGGFAYPIGPIRKITFHARTQEFTFQRNNNRYTNE